MSKNYLSVVWASLHEPRALTTVAVVTYVATAVVGVIIGALTLTLPSHQERDLVLAGFAMAAVLAGAVGAPSAWRGRHYREGVAALLIALAGFLAVMDAAMILTDPDPLRPRISTLAIWGGIQALACGIGRYFYLRNAGPYAPGKGPQLPEHRIRAVNTALEMQEVEASARAAANPKGD